uniref:Maturase K n=2 Tax=Podostemaceae TaxID=51590 RepID=Q8HW55_9ROSI|nr:maturase K [Terniopsis malayana]BAC20311.1 maturase K [Malaccotristicha australis]
MGKEKDQKYIDLAKSDKKEFLYPLIFQEYIYTLAHEHNLNRYTLLENLGYDKKLSFLIVKRLIARMYHQNYFPFSSDNFKQNFFFRYNKVLYSQKISEGFAIIVEIPFFLQFGTSFQNLEKKLEIVKVQNLQSIHSIFPFVEDQFYHFNFVFDGLLPYPIHLEKLVQTLRYWLKDPSSLHFLRLFLHEYSNGNNPFFQKKANSFLEKKNIRLFVFLYNAYIYEYESIVFFIRTQFCHLPAKRFQFFFERNYFYAKVNNFTKVFANCFPLKLELFKDPNLHYIRYQGKLVFGIRGMPLLMKKWKHYFVTLFECYFDVWFQPDKIQIGLLSKHSLTFVGYLLRLKFTPCVIRSQMLQKAFSIDNTRHHIETLIPIIPMIESLSKMKFCNKVGHPVSKPTWTDLLDSDIIDRFLRLCKNIAHYSSGSSKKKVLYQIHYILRFACLKTLARKHKISVRAFLKKQGSALLEEFFIEEQIASLIFRRNSSKSPYPFNQYKDRLWYLDILSINDLVNHN